MCRDDESFLLRRHFAFFLCSDGCVLSGCSFAGEVDDVLDCVCLFYHCRNTYRHCSFLVSSLAVWDLGFFLLGFVWGLFDCFLKKGGVVLGS